MPIAMGWSRISPVFFDETAPYERSNVRPKDGRSYGVKMSNRPTIRDAVLYQYTPIYYRKSEKPRNIWGDFSQGNANNCSTVASIKAVMRQFGKHPTDVFKAVHETADGYHITLRNNETTYLTKAEFKQAAAAAQFKGEDPQTVLYASFMYAVSAKRYQETGPASYSESLNILNSGGRLEYGFRRLGVWDQIEPIAPQQLAEGRTGVFESNGHAAIVVDGHEERWGNRGGRSPTSVIEVAYGFKA